MKKCLFILFFAFTAVLSAQTAPQQAVKPVRPQYWPLMIGNKLYMKMELALTTEEQRVGLMNRYSLPADGGMLFVFPVASQHTFWMKNCKIPLDLLFIDEKGIVVKIHNMTVEEPLKPGEIEELYDLTLTHYPSEKKAQFAVELAGGQAKLCGIKVGDTIQLRAADLLKLLK